MGLVAYFYHKTTRAPLVGGSPTALLVNANANSISVNNQVMTEITAMPGAYYHPYLIDSEIDYIGLYDPQNTDYTASVDKLFIPANRSGGGGGSINLSGITGSINNLKKDITKQISEIPQVDLNEIKSHIDLAKTDIIDTIDSIEIPEAKLEEKEAKKAVKLLNTLDKKVSGYIDSEMSDKEELGAIAREFTRLEMEDAMKEKEKEIEHKKKKEEEEKMEAEQDEKLLEEIKAEFAKADEKEKEDKRKELEKELEEIEWEKKVIEKELKSI